MKDLTPFFLAMGMVWALVWMGSNIMSESFKMMIMGIDKSPFNNDNAFSLRGLGNAAAGVGMSAQNMMLGSIAILLIGGVVIIMLMHRAFDLIYETADDVMKWIGNGVQQFGGEKENMQKVQGVVAGQFGRAEGRLSKVSLGAGGKGASVSRGEGGKGVTLSKGDPGTHVPGDSDNKSININKDK